MAKFKVSVDKELCIGCGACSVGCNNFKMVHGKAEVLNTEVEEKGCNADVEDQCPVSAITVEEI